MRTASAAPRCMSGSLSLSPHIARPPVCAAPLPRTTAPLQSPPGPDRRRAHARRLLLEHDRPPQDVPGDRSPGPWSHPMVCCPFRAALHPRPRPTMRLVRGESGGSSTLHYIYTGIGVLSRQNTERARVFSFSQPPHCRASRPLGSASESSSSRPVFRSPRPPFLMLSPSRCGRADARVVCVRRGGLGGRGPRSADSGRGTNNEKTPRNVLGSCTIG
jgi:hypothetical protein